MISHTPKNETSQIYFTRDPMSDKSKKVITRFAPSPTGYLHIGGARTALFNWLYAKANGGEMLLRIEDTDRERSTETAVDALKDGLSWLGINWDGEAYSQHERAERHRDIATKMVASGDAYYCYATPDELTAMRDKAREEGRQASYDGTWRDRDPSEAPQGAKGVIRLKTPNDGDTIIRDQVQGDVKFANKDLDDLVLLRSDGNPTYMLAVVVDDHDMGITHVIRGDDHLTNAARQALIYKALHWDEPVMAHIPLIHGADGAKISKRHGALGAEAYRALGYLPAALRNYLVRLGWSHGDDEIMSEKQMIEWFGFDGMGKGAAKFDYSKLDNLNGHYIRNSDDAFLVDQLALALPEFEGDFAISGKLDNDGKAKLMNAMPVLKERAKSLIELADGAHFLFAERPLQLEEKAAAVLDDAGRDALAKVLPAFETLSDWSHDAIEQVIRDVAEKEELKLGKIAQPLRSALTGRSKAPGVFDVLAILDKQEVLSRLKDQI